MVNNYKDEFVKMSNSLNLFINEVRIKNPNLMATDKWTVKDVLCHIVFWHRAYAQNYKALSLDRIPTLLEGPGYKLNEDGVNSLKNNSIEDLINKLKRAQSVLYKAIVKDKVPKMTYKKNGRIYKTLKFLPLVERHIYNHTKQVKRAKLCT